MRPAVVDASVTLAWLNRNRLARALLADRSPWLAPDLIHAEVMNGLWKLVTFEDVPTSTAERVLDAFHRAPIQIRPLKPIQSRAFHIAVDLGQPAYDCFYLALAIAEDASVVTADKQLASKVEGGPYERYVEWIGEVA